MTVVALAGRRIDAAGQESARFPQTHVAAVRQRLRDAFVKEGMGVLVSSAACGVDLIGQDVAATLGLRRVIVLPFARARFRETSVVDRPGDWGPMFDRLVSSVSADDLRVGRSPTEDAAYLHVNATILDVAQEIAKGDAVVALVAWDGQRREGDVTGAFIDAARRRGLPLVSVPTT